MLVVTMQADKRLHAEPRATRVLEIKVVCCGPVNAGLTTPWKETHEQTRIIRDKRFLFT